MDEMYNYGVDGIGNRTGGCMPGNRPVCCSNVTGRGIAKTYDHMGRMAGRVEAQDGTVSHERYLYRGYLRIAALDMLDTAALIHAAVWDPTEPAATRPLLLQTPSGWFTYSFDQAKNVTELFDSAGGIAAAHDHGPFGEDMAATGSAAGLNPFRFSSEVWDGALGLVYYNWRHYNPLDGRLLSRDPIGERGGLNLYGFVGNDPVNRWDLLGLNNSVSSPWTVTDATTGMMDGTPSGNRLYCPDNGEVIGEIQIRVGIDASITENLQRSVPILPPGSPDPSHPSYLSVRIEASAKITNRKAFERCCGCKNPVIRWRQKRKAPQMINGNWTDDDDRHAYYWYSDSPGFSDEPGGNGQIVPNRAGMNVPESRDFAAIMYCKNNPTPSVQANRNEKVIAALIWGVTWEHSGKSHSATLSWFW